MKEPCLTIERMSTKMTIFCTWLFSFVWRQQNNPKGLTPANGISPGFVLPQKVLSDTNKNILVGLFCPQIIRKAYIWYSYCITKQWSNFLKCKTNYSATYLGSIECQIRTTLYIVNELIDIRFNRFDTSLHCRYGISITLQFYSLPKYNTGTIQGDTDCTIGITPLKITSKYKYVI